MAALSTTHAVALAASGLVIKAFRERGSGMDPAVLFVV
jgi:hypothetical protein